jgi:ComF family protein
MDAAVLSRFVRGVVGAALDLVYPPRCYACDAETEGEPEPRLCDPCRAALVPILNPCPRCAAPRGPGVEGRRCPACRSLRPGFRAAVAAVEYRGPAPLLVQRLKYAGERFQAYLLGEMIGRSVAEAGFAGDPDVVVPVPLAPVRRRERGFNQAGLLAVEAGRLLGLPVRDRWLARPVSTLPQAGLSRRARLRNLEGCFRARRRGLRGAAVLLVDDVLTTGATLSEAARTCRRAGARAVYAAVFARA